MDEPTAKTLSQSIEVQLAGQPDTKNQWGSGSIRPERVVFYYLNDPITINAILFGSWVRPDGEATDAPLEQLYRGTDDGWPDWLTTMAREHTPAAEIEALREEHKASLRHADEINNQLMEEVQRYAAGTERPVLWSVYNEMHLRADNAEAAIERVRRLHDNLDAETDLTSPDDEITRGAAARKIAAALDGWTPSAAPSTAGRAAVLAEAADDLAEFIALHGPTSRTVAGWRGAVGFLRRRAAETAACVCGEPSTSGTVHRTDGPCHIGETAGPETQGGWHLTSETLDLFVRALVNEVDYDIHKGYECGEEDGEDHYPELVTEAAEMLNAITAAVQTEQATPCSQPNPCENGGDPCTTHEWEQAHAEGDHGLCGPECDEAQQPETVAYFHPDVPNVLLCRTCGERPGLDVTPLASENLPNGGICTRCGVDVLIPQPAVQTEETTPECVCTEDACPPHCPCHHTAPAAVQTEEA